MSGANEVRGEIAITLEGVSYVMRPTYEAIVAIERLTGRSLRILAQSAGDGSLTTEQAAIVVTECCKAQGKATGDATMADFNPRRVGELLIDAGMLQASARIELLLFLAVTGGYTAKGEAKAAQTTTEATPSDD